MNIENQEIVAIKKVKEEFNNWDRCMKLTEIKALKKLNHPNIIKLKEVIKFNNKLYFVFEYLKQDLFTLYKSMIGFLSIILI